MKTIKIFLGIALILSVVAINGLSDEMNTSDYSDPRTGCMCNYTQAQDDWMTLLTWYGYDDGLYRDETPGFKEYRYNCCNRNFSVRGKVFNIKDIYNRSEVIHDE